MNFYTQLHIFYFGVSETRRLSKLSGSTAVALRRGRITGLLNRYPHNLEHHLRLARWVEGDIDAYTTSKTRHDTFAVDNIRTWLNNSPPDAESRWDRCWLLRFIAQVLRALSREFRVHDAVVQAQGDVCKCNRITRGKVSLYINFMAICCYPWVKAGVSQRMPSIHFFLSDHDEVCARD